MKNIVSLLFVATLVMSSCTGDRGPMGPPGEDGGLIEASAFEIEIDFNADNQFSYTENFGFEVLETDVALVYISWETTDGIDIWRLMPQQVHFDNGVLIYNYDFTQTDVSFFLDGTVNFTTLDSQWVDKQVFRVVVVPAKNVGVDFSNLNDVMQAYNINSFELK